MIPYGDFTYFYICLVLMLPVIILGLVGKRSLVYNRVITLVMLILIFSDENKNLYDNKFLSYQFIFFALYICYQVVLIRVYISIAKKTNQFKNYAFAIVLSILPLIIVKILQSSWLGDFQITVHGNKLIEFIGFLGISYIAFKSVQLIMEIRDNRIKSINTMKLIDFITFFPTISSGPIDRYKRFIKDEEKIPEPNVYYGMLIKAIHMVFMGFLYKYIIAYYINENVIKVTPIDTDPTFLNYLYYMYGYSFYLFFDFAGYSLFAIAFSYLFGIQTPINFNKPFKAKNIKEFWNRWHMSLSFWFRDCIYMRFVFWVSKEKLLKDKLLISNLGFLINFFIMGIWHGIEIQYILYGLYHAFLFIAYGYFEQWRKKHPPKLNYKLMNVIAILITFHSVAFGFLLFSGKLIH
ncbi:MULTISPECIES: D-alanyl-lipoteichoic acid biosynthesis protein DltB [Mammaliicoccus]|uniref:D-alanyl-lipoteichoic acid biosynthesis protein DltB n=1 Tax=Mammaliicoccus TaxID=2803850 RepID=UPI001EFB28C2|nr:MULTISPECIES: D-alanyl-lipoteichoic acid biosynthesis protein DltB [Mammaliicoccus]MEB7723814.1 D-alanyl-lipoteichoic acid biosynthesis protein DltB [Mammaliicoccus fleurettii]MEB8068390.1 D-alanyl-lipoteichoic acid biosynthesis protein DltB [Mammaliicoccus fleurettii]